MNSEAGIGIGNVSFNPSVTEDVNFLNGVWTPFNGEGCNLHLSAGGQLEVQFLQDNDFRVITFPAGGWDPSKIKSVKNTYDFANIECAGK